MLDFDFGIFFLIYRETDKMVRHDLFLIFIGLVILLSGVLGLLYGFGFLPLKTEKKKEAPDKTTAPADDKTTAPAGGDETAPVGDETGGDETGGDETGTSENESNTVLIALGSVCAVLGVCLVVFVIYRLNFGGPLALFQNQWAAFLIGLFVICLGALMVWGLDIKESGVAVMYSGVGWIWTGICLYGYKTWREWFSDQVGAVQKQIQENAIEPLSQWFDENLVERQTALLAETNQFMNERDENRAEVMRSGSARARTVSFLLQPFEYMAYYFIMFFGSLFGNIREAERRVQRRTQQVLTDASGRILRFGTTEYNEVLRQRQEQLEQVRRAGGLQIGPPE
jgi:hypothetical protein